MIDWIIKSGLNCLDPKVAFHYLITKCLSQTLTYVNNHPKKKTKIKRYLIIRTPIREDISFS